MKAARFIVEAHAHITTLYKSTGKAPREVERYDNSAFTLYDMGVYDVDMCILKPSWIGTTNEMQAELVDRYPDKFRACCQDTTLHNKVAHGEAEWTLEAAVEEVESALNWGKDQFVCIGEFVPRNRDPNKIYAFRERLDEWRKFMDLAAKYGVTIDFHELSFGYEWDAFKLLSRVSREYPNVPIIINHGHGGAGIPISEDTIQNACKVAGRGENTYLECGGWPAEYFEIAIKNLNIGVTHLIWGHDYGNTPQYITAHLGEKYKPSIYPTLGKLNWPHVPKYQTDFWGWSLYEIHKIREWVTQDEINLILGGNAAKIFKLPVPQPRMFPCGRPDLWGMNWEKSVPFLPAEQIQNPDTPQPYRW